MAENKLTRELSTRAVSQRPMQWMPPELLPEPDKQAGYVYRWIRVSMLDKPDPRNVSSKLREGWEAVPIEEQPKFKLLINPDSRFKDNIEVGGLLLCKMPEEFLDQRSAHYQQLTKAQADAVDSQLMGQNDARMPLFKERRSTTSFGKGK